MHHRPLQQQSLQQLQTTPGGEPEQSAVIEDNDEKASVLLQNIVSRFPVKWLLSTTTREEINCKTEIPTMLLCPTPYWIWWHTYEDKDRRGSSIYPTRLVRVLSAHYWLQNRKGDKLSDRSEQCYCVQLRTGYGGKLTNNKLSRFVRRPNSLGMGPVKSLVSI
jgi:hypothetical protein